MEKQSLALRPAKITIAQERLNIQTDLSDQELEKILEYLNRKIEKYIGENTNETKKRLLLMALDISAEFFDIRHRYHKLAENEKNIEKEISTLNNLLQQELDDQKARES